MKNLILIVFAAMLFCGCKKDADPATLIVGKWQLVKQTSEYYENGVLTDPPVYTGPIPVDTDTLNVAFTSIQFNADKTGVEEYTIGQPPFNYTLAKNQLTIICPPYNVRGPDYDPYNPYLYDLGFSGIYQVSVTKVSLTLFASGTVKIDTNKTVTVNKTMYFSRE